ncbi:hypothetical protein NM208_g1654 [Fusarium decemcellulare]|uniref:Uncharacterized protein n=1 Tax=Fusarium decemcellulare TaxID=57161 RepID=A0ACC1SVF7_9HYPO|nr:hypothetical protein NM208_g1654 [Fusarium decemcellulare]
MASDTAAGLKPRVLVCASPATGHTNPMITIADELVQRGYEVSFIAGVDFRNSIEAIGARVIVPLPGISEMAMIARASVPVGVARLQFDMKEFFLDRIKERHEFLYKALEQLREEDTARDIVIVTESFYLGTHALYLGAPLPKGFINRPKIINIHAATYMTTSKDVAPFGFALMPDATEEGRKRNKSLHEQMINGPFKDMIEYEGKVLASLGAVDYKPAMLFDTWTTSHDITLQMCPPSLEYPMSDLHPKIRFAGAPTPRPPRNNIGVPDFWDEVNRSDKRIVTVTQGTVDQDFGHLIIPTMQALATRTDVLVVAILGKKGATLPGNVQLPPNARATDYLPYDLILPHTSVFVLNAGYGGLIHGVVNGVPMVLAGESEDKAEVANHAEYAAIGVNLKTETPTSQQIDEAITKILNDGSYKTRVMEIKKENEDMKAIDRLEKVVLECADVVKS